MLLCKNVFLNVTIQLSVVRVVTIVCVKSNENIFLHTCNVNPQKSSLCGFPLDIGGVCRELGCSK